MSIINLKDLRSLGYDRQKSQHTEKLEEKLHASTPVRSGRVKLPGFQADLLPKPVHLGFALQPAFCPLLCCRGRRKQAYKNTRKNTLECTVSLRAFGIRSAVAFEPALRYDEISQGIT